MAVSDTSPNEDNGFIGVGIVYWRAVDDTFWRDVGECPKFEFTPSVDSLDWFSHRSGIKKRLKSIVTQQSGSIAMTLQEGTGKNWALTLMGSEDDAVAIMSATLVTSSGSTAVTGVSPTSALVTNRRYSVSGTGIPAGDTMVFNGGSTATLDAPATASGTISGSGTIASLGDKSSKIFSQSQVNGSLMFVGANDQGAPVMVEFRNVAIKPSSAIAFIQDAAIGALEVTADVYLDDGGDFGHFDWNIDTGFVPYLGP